MEERVLTAPLALIKQQVAGELRTIGKMRSLRVTETIRRIDVKGIGEFYPVEKAPVDWSGSLNAQSFAIDLKKTGVVGSPNRSTNDPEKFANTLMLDEKGVSIYIYKKVKNEVDPDTGIVTSVLPEPFAIIRNLFIEREGFDITDGQVSGRDQDFSYLTPILFE